MRSIYRLPPLASLFLLGCAGLSPDPRPDKRPTCLDGIDLPTPLGPTEGSLGGERGCPPEYSLCLDGTATWKVNSYVRFAEGVMISCGRGAHRVE